MTTFSIAANIFLFIALCGLANYALRERMSRKQRGLFKNWPVPKISVSELDPIFHPGEFGPGIDAEIRYIGRGNLPVFAGTSDFETWILAALSKNASRIFEFGTGTGRNTYMMAANARQEAEIITLTLHPEGREDYQHETGDNAKGEKAARDEADFSEFFYSDKPESKKITQIFADSKAHDTSPYDGTCDLVFVDGAHTYSYLKNDTQKALRMVKPGGIVLWHDYRGPRKTKDVFRFLNELCAELALKHISGTSLVAYRRSK